MEQHIFYSSFNNTIVTITDTQGNVISWASAGGLDLKVQEKKAHHLQSRSSSRNCIKSSNGTWIKNCRSIC